VLDALLATSHQSINDLHARVAARGIPVDLSSVHRIVEAFVSVGLVHALPTVDGSTYGLADRPHHHAICTRCGRLQEIPAPQLSAALADIAQSTGLHVAPDDPAGGLIVYGTCGGCEESAAQRTRQ
jgi:Fe2+ or Zn2+ uptake regulation protein